MSDYREVVNRALDEQVDLLRAVVKEDFFSRYVEGWLEAKHVEKEGELPKGFTTHTYADATVNAIGEALSRGACYAVTEDMCELLAAASHHVPDWKLAPADLPSEQGFAYFDGGMLINDVRGKNVIISALAWNSNIGSKGVGMWMFSNLDDPRDGYVAGDPEWLPTRAQLPDVIVRYSLTSMSGWNWGETPQETYGMHMFSPPEIPGQDSGFRWVNVMAALWRLLDETYVEHRDIQPARPTARRASRGGIPEPKLRIVRLRRRESKPAREEETLPDGRKVHEYSHRWMVEPFWRDQYYPSMGPAKLDDGSRNPDSHRPKYIARYIKGPEDKPLVIHDVAYSLDR